jgi:coenzyme F420-reducing hydrogenase beta subunit
MERFYIAKHKKINIRMASRSGGVFTALSDEWLTRGGVIYGCVMEDDFKVHHIRTENPEGRDRMRGSKYVQSELENCFSLAKEDLKDERYVLFSGTSCQIAGLRSFLGKEEDKLLCIDIVCHGVPSPLVWNDYLNYWRKKSGKRIIGFDFRNKEKFGWASHIETLEFSNEKVDSRTYTELFYQHRILRPSCYQCPYKSLTHPGDITIADAWGVQEANPEFNDNKGVSLLLINTSLGETIIKYIDKDCIIKKIDITKYMQEPLIKPFEKPFDREQFWNEYLNKTFTKIATRYTDAAFHRQVRLWIRKQQQYLKKMIGR